MRLATALKLLLLSFFLCGCSYGHSIETDVTLLGGVHPPSRFVESHFGDYDGHRPYIQIAHIRVLGNEHSSTGSLLATARAKARALGADALIQLETSSIHRETGDLFVDTLDLIGAFIPDDEESCEEEDEDYDYSYDALVLTGVAVKFSGDGSNAGYTPLSAGASQNPR